MGCWDFTDFLVHWTQWPVKFYKGIMGEENVSVSQRSVNKTKMFMKYQKSNKCCKCPVVELIYYLTCLKSAVCGESLTGSEGTITSPGFPDVYPHGINCIWTINVQPGYLIRLTFTSFNLPFHSSCRMDYLEIYDNSTMQKLGRWICSLAYRP